MRKGLKSTLLTVAVALLGLNAMAMAPVISNIPDVVIGDAEAGTATNLFVFPNAFDSRTVVSDDTTSVGAIRWTFSTAAATKYLINGHTSTFGAAVDTVNPTSTFDLTLGSDDPNSNISGTSITADTDLRTFTFRNIHYSPIAGPNTDPGHPGVTTDSQTLTLVASDGSTASLGKSFRAMILNNGRDQLSGVSLGTPVYTQTWTDGAVHGWSSWNFSANGGTVNLTNSTSGLCADPSLSGNNFAGWQSEPSSTNYTTVAFVDNAVYRIRTTVTTVAQPGHTPLWFILYENSVDWYGGFFQFFDSGVFPNAGAETPSGTGTVYEEWANPPAETTAGFKAILTNPTLSVFKNFRIELGVLDVGFAGNDSYDASNDTGAVCWKDIHIDKFDITGVSVTSTAYNHQSDFTQAPAGTAGTADATLTDMTVSSSGTGNGSSTVTFGTTAGSKNITIAPTSATAWQTNSEFFFVSPGDSQTNSGLNSAADFADNFPIPWTTGQLYQITYKLQAPSPLAESNPPSYFYMGGESATIELISYCYTTNQLTPTGGTPSAMPKLAAAQSYISYYHGNTQSLATGFFRTWRPFMIGGSVAAFQNPVVSGGLTITGNRVDLVHF